MFESFERKSTIGIEIVEKLNFSKLAEHIGESVKIYGFFITTKSKYGDSVAVVTSPETAITLPKRYVDIFRNLSDEEIEAITSGKVTLANIREKETRQGMTTTFDITM